MIRLALVGCSNTSRYERIAGRLLGGGIVAATDPDLMARQFGGCDAVVIQSDSRSRADLAIQAAAAGKHVLVALPLAGTADEADRVIQSCRDSGVCLMVAQEKRFLPAVAAVRESLASGKLGAPGLLRIHRWEPPVGNGSSPLEEVMAEIDLAQWLFGDLPEAVHAISDEPRGRPYLQIHFGFAGGGMALIDYAATLPAGRGYFSLTLIGSNGAAYADDHHNTHLVFGGGDPRALVADQDSACLVSQVQEFVDAIRERREPAVNGGDGRSVLEIAGAVRRSISSSRSLRRQGGDYELAG